MRWTFSCTTASRIPPTIRIHSHLSTFVYVIKTIFEHNCFSFVVICLRQWFSSWLCGTEYSENKVNAEATFWTRWRLYYTLYMYTVAYTLVFTITLPWKNAFVYFWFRMFYKFMKCQKLVWLRTLRGGERCILINLEAIAMCNNSQN